MLVIGAGGAGVMAAVEAERAGASVIVASKEPLGYGDTRIALGIMSTSPDAASGDSEEAFVEDMIRGGEYLNDPKLVRALVGDAMDATLTVEGFGHIFSRDAEGVLNRMALPPGGHRASRAISSSWLGVSLCHALRSAAARASIEVLEETVCSELLVLDGEVVGAAALRMMTGEPVALLAKSTVVAAGGGGSLYYPHTDCMPAVIGDSFGLGLRAGAELVDITVCALERRESRGAHVRADFPDHATWSSTSRSRGSAQSRRSWNRARSTRSSSPAWSVWPATPPARTTTSRRTRSSARTCS